MERRRYETELLESAEAVSIKAERRYEAEET